MTGTADDAPAADALARLVTAATDTAFDDLADDTRLVGRSPGDGDGSGPASHAAVVFEDATAVIGVVPRVDAEIARRLLAAVDEGAAVRLVVTGRALDAASGMGGVGLRAAVGSRNVELFAHDRTEESAASGLRKGQSADSVDVPLALLFVDDRALIGLFDDEGLAAVLSTTDPGVCGWVVECFERYREASSPLFE